MFAPVAVVVLLALNKNYVLGFPIQGLTLHWFRALVGAQEWRVAFRQSAIIGFTAALIACVLGTSAAIGLRDSRYAALLTPLFLLPLIVPAIVTAIALFFFYAQLGLLGTTKGLILAHGVIAFPYAFLITWGAVRGLDRRLSQAAASLGANPWRVVLRIIVPMLTPAIVGSFIVAAAVSFDEVLVTLFLSDPTTRTVPVVIWSNITESVDPTTAASSVIVMFVNGSVLLLASIAARWTIRRRQMVNAE